MRTSAATNLLNGVFESAGDEMSPEVARWIASLRADDALQARVDELADRNTEGKITPEELAEYDLYLQVGELISLLQLKASRILSRSNAH